MSLQNRIVLFLLGLVIWIAGSIFYAYRGALVLETTSLRYWVSFFLMPPLSAILVVLSLKLLRISPADWASAALLVAIPGMVGEAIVLSNLSRFMPRIRESSGGRYGAMLFAAYAVVLAIAEFVTLRAAP